VTWVLRIAAFLAVSYLVVLLAAWLLQDALAFPAPRHTLPDPAAVGMAGAERVTVTTSDGLALNGWYLPPFPPPVLPAPALIWFTGNMETVGAMAPVLRAFRPPGTAVLAVDYRGYGENPGKPSEQGIYRDAAAAWDWLAARPGIDSAQIAVYGRSIGSVPALWLATARSPVAVVLDSPFTSARAMARRHYWFLPRFLIRLELDNLARVGAVRAPVLVVHGTADRIAPFAMGEALAAAAPDGRLLPLDGAGHNETFTLGGAMYRDTLHAFLAQAAGTHAP
jgi:hypothetical protein